MSSNPQERSIDLQSHYEKGSCFLMHNNMTEESPYCTSQTIKVLSHTGVCKSSKSGTTCNGYSPSLTCAIWIWLKFCCASQKSLQILINILHLSTSPYMMHISLDLCRYFYSSDVCHTKLAFRFISERCDVIFVFVIIIFCT